MRLFCSFEPLPQPNQELNDGGARRRQQVLVVVKAAEVVDVAQIAAHAQAFLHKMIQRIQVHIGKELAGQVADRDAAPARGGREQLVVRVVLHDGFLLVGAVDDHVAEPEDVRRIWCFKIAWSIVAKNLRMSIFKT